MNKKTEEIIEDKQITEIQKCKKIFTTKPEEIEELKKKLTELEYTKGKERGKQLDTSTRKQTHLHGRWNFKKTYTTRTRMHTR